MKKYFPFIFFILIIILSGGYILLSLPGGKFSKWGKVCSDSTECKYCPSSHTDFGCEKGLCIANLSPEEEELLRSQGYVEKTGRCLKEKDVTGGGYYIVEKGKVEMLTLIDTFDIMQEFRGFLKHFLIKFFVIHFLTSSIILLIGYIILGKFYLVNSGKFFTYLFFVIIANILITYAVIFGCNTLIMILKMITHTDLKNLSTALLIFFPIVSLIGVNYWLSRRLFSLQTKQALFVGVLATVAFFIGSLISFSSSSLLY